MGQGFSTFSMVKSTKVNQIPQIFKISSFLKIGQWENGKFHGEGRYYWPNNTKYYGEFKNDQIDGYGVCYYLDGGIY